MNISIKHRPWQIIFLVNAVFSVFRPLDHVFLLGPFKTVAYNRKVSLSPFGALPRAHFYLSCFHFSHKSHMQRILTCTSPPRS